MHSITDTVKLQMLLVGGALSCLAFFACEDTPILTTTRNLNRPGPLALVCAGRQGDASIATGLSPSRCTSDAGTVDGVKGTLYGFVANTAKGEVAVFRPGASSAVDRLVDLDKGSPGYGFIPVGSLPTDLIASRNGCLVVTANSGSCDLALIDVPAVMDIAASVRKKASGSLVSRLVVATASGRPLRSRPHEILLVPSTDLPKAKGTDTCPVPGAYRAYVTFPSCNLVAEVDLATGKIKQGLVLHKDGTASLNNEPACPAECALSGDNKLLDMGAPDARPADKGTPDSKPKDAGVGDGAQPDAADANVSTTDGAAADVKPGQPDLPGDAGPSDLKVSSRGVLPTGMALEEVSTKDSRLYISSAGAGFIWAVDVKDDVMQLSPGRVLLEGGVTTSRLKLSPKPQNKSLSRYLYAIAGDRSVRVISLSTTPGQECETQLDLTKVTDKEVDLTKAGCFVVSDATRKLRKVTATGPGLTFSDRVPMDVEFITGPLYQVDATLEDTRPKTTPLQGIFALVSVSDGIVYIIDVEDWTLVKSTSTKVPRLRLPHRRRNLYLGTKNEEPDASIVSVSGAKTGGIPVLVSAVKPTVATDASVDVPGHGLLLRAPGQSVAADWFLTYEERLVARWSGSISLEKGELIFRDKGAKFCSTGVEARSLDNGKRPLRHGDLLIMVGCRNDDECGLGQECIKAIGNPSEYGLCLEKGREEDLYSKCLPFLSAKREFVISEAKSDQLKLEMLSEVPVKLSDIKSGSNCSTNADCPARYLCALKDQTVTGLKKGDCFRPGCTPDKGSNGATLTTSKDCLSSHRCVKPLDGSAEICVPVVRPIETAAPCSTDDQCNPAKLSPAAPKLNAACGNDSDCGNTLLECRRSPITSTQTRCLAKGMTCQAVGEGGKKVCARVTPCFDQLLRYDIRAGRSFVVGSYKRGVEDQVTGLCKSDPKKSALYSNRIYIGQPVFPVALGQQCQPGDVKFPGTPQPNGCYEVRKTEGYEGVQDVVSDKNYTFAKEASPATVVRFANPDIWLTLGVSHLAKPMSSAVASDAGIDASAVPPMPTRELTLRYQLGSGFFPLRTGSNKTVSLPARLVEGPDGYVYLVDMGDRPGSAGTNGQVLRINRSSALLDNFIVR